MVFTVKPGRRHVSVGKSRSPPDGAVLMEVAVPVDQTARSLTGARLDRDARSFCYRGHCMRKRKILVCLVLLLASLAFVLWLLNWMRIDTCLDRGGAWNYEAKSCEGAVAFDGGDPVRLMLRQAPQTLALACGRNLRAHARR
jgi:hypothetical protein